MTATLRAAGALDRAEVVGLTCTVMHLDKGITGTLARLSLAYDRVETNAPPSLVAKFSSPDPGLRAVIHSMGFFEREARFYRELAADTPVRTPRCYFAGVDPAEGWSLILLEDLTGHRNGSWVDGSSLEDLRVALKAIVEMHSAWWQSPALATKRWLDLAGPTSVPQMQEIAVQTWPGFLARLSVPVSREMLEAGELMRQYLQVTGEHLLETEPRTLIHHDFDGDNLFFRTVDGATELVVIDWQLATRGRPGMDLAWLVAGQCDPAQRRACEHDLVRRYHRRLMELGVSGYPFEQCWDDYRLAMLLAAARVSSSVGFQADGPKGGFWDVVFPRYSSALADLRVGELVEARQTGRGSS